MQSTDGIDPGRTDPEAGPDTTGREQRERARGWADSARAARHAVRDELSTGRISLAELLGRAHEDELVGQVKLLWALESLPGARKVDTRRTLAAMGLDDALRLGALDHPTTTALLAAFGSDGVGGSRS
jgi:hypothetical protein